MELAEDARKLRARHVEQRGIGEHAVEAFAGQVEPKEVLLEHLAAAVRARHGRRA